MIADLETKTAETMAAIPTIMLAVERGTAECVTATGGRLAEDLGARLVLVHVRDDPPLFNSKRDRERARNRAIRRGRQVLAEALEALSGGLEADSRVELGDPANELSEVATEVGAALIVAGTRGRGRLTAALLGSVSRELARRAPCPVMIVPESAATRASNGRVARRENRSTIIAGVDGSQRSSAAAGLARRLADRLDGQLLIVPLHSTPDPPAHVLQGIAASERARSIVIADDCCDARRLALMPSLPAQLLRLAPCPVIVRRDGATATLGVPDAIEERQAA
jgi:nucleotide-binding universal stress UspA family protein